MQISQLTDWFLYNPAKPMLFTQIYFWIFFCIVLIGYSIIYKSNKLRNIYLFVFSLFFYYKSGGYFFSLLIFSTIVDYLIALAIGKTRTESKRILLVSSSVVINLGVLAYFKYAYFFTEWVNTIFHSNFVVTNYLALAFNSFSGSHFDVSTIVLPVGISFYTFQTISYSIDVYRRKIEPVKSILDFGFYVTFFPQLVAGPIVRAADFIPQLYEKYKLTRKEFGYAVFFILNGLVKKMAVSDYISANFVDRIFENPGAYSGFENLLGVYGYALQIYCDFSGYTDIAIGTALLLGFRLPKNFDSPYKANSITDFWRRWHISLSTWLRDYLYIPLGGNRKGKIRQYVNLLITMLLGGLWHGAHIRFVIWGGIHGLALAFDKAIMSLSMASRIKNNPFVRIAGVILTFHLVCLAWIFFRATSIDSVSVIFNQLATGWNFQLIPSMLLAYRNVLTIMLIAYVIHWLPEKYKVWYQGRFIDSGWVAQTVVTVAIVFVIYQFRSASVQPFIYFQF